MTLLRSGSILLVHAKVLPPLMFIAQEPQIPVGRSQCQECLPSPGSTQKSPQQLPPPGSTPLSTDNPGLPLLSKAVLGKCGLEGALKLEERKEGMWELKQEVHRPSPSPLCPCSAKDLRWAYDYRMPICGEKKAMKTPVKIQN